MRTYSKTTEETLVAFHIGRGGHFYNSGHLSYIDQDVSIRNYTDDLFLGFENFSKILIQAQERGYDNVVDAIERADDEPKIYDRLKKFGIDLGEQIFTHANGCPVGLTLEEAESGVGCINIDNDYDTTYVKELQDCTEKEFKTIFESNNYKSVDVLDYVKEQLADE